MAGMNRYLGDSDFVYCRSGRPDVKEVYDSRRADGIAEQEKILKRTIKKCLLMKPQGGIVVDTDKKTTYPKLLADVLGNVFGHIRPVLAMRMRKRNFSL